MNTFTAPAILIQGSNIVLVMDGNSHTISKDTHMNYEKIVEAIKTKAWQLLRDLVNPTKAIIKFGKGNVSIVDGVVFWNKVPFHNALATRMIEMYLEDFSIDPMVRFMENLMMNPSKRSVDQLYGFLEKNKLPITDDGHFLAYKRVRADYLDCHSGKVDNSIGQLVKMDRNLVDDNPDSYCSAGLHFCSEEYLDGFGQADWPVMILKVNPADVVSIPSDCNGAKGRCSKYEVIAEVVGSPKAAFNKVVDRQYVKPDANWPFVNSSDDSGADDTFDIDCDDFDFDDDNFDFLDQLYDLVRVHGGTVEYADMTLDQAKDRQHKNVCQKKAMLKIVKAGTDEEV